MSFLSPPKPPDPYQTREQLNSIPQAAQKQQQMNMINQYTPYGSLNYTSDPNAPGGYSATQTLTPEQQQILNLLQQGQTGAGTAAAGLGGQLAGLYGQPANLDTQITDQSDDELAEPVHTTVLGYSKIKPGGATAKPRIESERCRLAELDDGLYQGYWAGAEPVFYPG